MRGSQSFYGIGIAIAYNYGGVQSTLRRIVIIKSEFTPREIVSHLEVDFQDRVL